MRLLRKGGPLVLAALVLGSGAFVVARSLKGRGLEGGGDRPSPTVSASPSTTPPAVSGTPLASAEPRIGQSSGPSGPKPIPVATPPRTSAPGANGASAGSGSAGKGVKRTVTLASLQPPYGVHMAIDGRAAPDLSPVQGLSFSLDDKAHTLSFTCEQDMCEPRSREISPGDKDESIEVALRIRPAQLLVDGDPSHSYAIEEMPHIVLGAGGARDIPMAAGAKTVTVFDRTDPKNRRQAQLRAGQQVTVSFR
jgi:hypothetical protein